MRIEGVELASRLAGGVWGHLVGDAVGVGYEFRSPEAVGEVVFGASDGPWRQPPGTWSDDGALMLALLDSLLSSGFDPEDQARRAISWALDGTYTPDGDGRFDVGRTTRTALSAFASGTLAIDAGPAGEGASGNGSLMRILPLALVERSLDDAALVEHAQLASRVTHGHPRCQVACAIYSLVARRLLCGLAPEDALAAGLAALRAIYAEAGYEALRAALGELEAWPERHGDGFVLDAFWSAWDAFAGASSYRETIERAVRYGNDTDTTAAIAGGLAGIQWGWQGIPLEWRRGMRGGEIASPLVDRLVATAGASTSSLEPLPFCELDLAGLGLRAGCLGISVLPGQKRDGVMGLRWRDLDADLARLVEREVDVLFLLVEDPELEGCLVPDLAEAMRPTAIELVRFPVRDPRVPTDDAAFRRAIRDLLVRLRSGARVAIACRWGLDRSGMAAACLLIEAGLATEEAIDRVHRARRGSLTFPEQLAYVRGWVAGGAA